MVGQAGGAGWDEPVVPALLDGLQAQLDRV